MDALAESENVLVDGGGLVEVEAGVEALVSSEVGNAKLVPSAFNHEDGVGTRTDSVCPCLSCLPVPDEGFNHGPRCGHCHFFVYTASDELTSTPKFIDLQLISFPQAV